MVDLLKANHSAPDSSNILAEDRTKPEKAEPEEQVSRKPLSTKSKPVKNAKKRLGLFVDVQNIYYTTQHTYQRKFNYRELWQRLDARFEIVIANAYAIHRGDEQQLKFQNALKNIGFTIKLKPYIQRRDGSAKGDWDVGITIDILEAARELETVILLSGDGDFDLLLEKIERTYGVTTEVYGVAELTSRSLIESASFFHPITDDLLI